MKGLLTIIKSGLRKFEYIFGLINTLSSNEVIKASTIQTLSDLKINDLVVHQDHGIGKYKGLINGYRE